MNFIPLESSPLRTAGVLAGVAPELDPVSGVAVANRLPQERAAVAGMKGDLGVINTEDVTSLSREEREALGKFYDSLANRRQDEADFARTDAESLARDLGGDMNTLLAEEAQSGRNLPIASLTGAAEDQTGRPLLIVRPPRAASDDTPILSAFQLGTAAVEALKPELKANPMIGQNYVELKQFVLLSLPESGIISLFDNSNGGNFALLDVEDMTAAEKQKWIANQDAAQNIGQPSQKREIDARPLHVVILDFLTSNAAYIVYAVILVCWAAWRYVIRRYA